MGKLITLRKYNSGSTVTINTDFIEKMETDYNWFSKDETTVTLKSGEKIKIEGTKESIIEIINKS